MAQTLRIGPAYILTAPTLATAGGSWVNLGSTRGDVIVQPEPGNVGFFRTDQTGIARFSSGAYYTGMNVNVQAPLLDQQLDTLLKAFPAAAQITADTKDAIGFGTGTSTLTPQAFAVVPVSEYDTLGADDWGDSQFVVWLPKGVAQVNGSFVFNLPDGEDSLQAYDTTFHSLMENTALLFGIGYKANIESELA